jgi:hypothetical protein
MIHTPSRIIAVKKASGGLPSAGRMMLSTTTDPSGAKSPIWQQPRSIMMLAFCVGSPPIVAAQTLA